MSHPALPPPVSRPWLVVAAAVWMIAAMVHVQPLPEPLAPGRQSGQGVMATDVIAGRFGSWALAETDSGPLMLSFRDHLALVLGDIVRFEGTANGIAGLVRGRPHRSRVNVIDIELIGRSGSPPLALGNAVRDRVMENLQPFDDGRALLAGFLIGETGELDRADIEAMRLSGLSHFVAVSGSNVAMFLLLLALAAGPLALGPKRRALIGLLGLPVYAAATRFEPSVLRASVMAALALGGRLVGVVFEAWQLLALAVVLLVVADPGITTNIGFQLSVAATAGVLVGARWPTGGGKVERALIVTCGAQVAVAPLLLVHFGSIPLLSPVINLVAAPLVTASTVLGAVAVGGAGFLTGPAAWTAELVLRLARGAATWPQVTAWPLCSGMLAGLVAWRWPRSRQPIGVALAGVAVVMILGVHRPLPDPGVVVLDVGQGDSILLHGGGGRFALVDGGPDPTVLIGKLRQYGVTGLDLVVLTHVHADHVTGLTGLLDRIPIGEIWVAADPHQTPASRDFFTQLERVGITPRTPGPGEIVQLGELSLIVEGPHRRYASPNDQSIVITVQGPQRSMLLTGDIEVVAQRELPHLRADILKVPHQGAATSDPEWLISVGASRAVISVGPNNFGHPAGWVIDLFGEHGIDVNRTDLDGDIALGL